jgi:Bacterial Alpha-2-macroglobulin MG10 domain/MG2 domain/Alpha-2-macroglobulin family
MYIHHALYFQPINQTNHMKRIVSFFALLLSLAAAAQDYEPQWQEVVNLEKQGLTRSAAEKTDAIYRQAKKDRNEPQIIKTFFFRERFMIVLEEDARQKLVNAIKADIKEASPEGRAIMESLYASMLEDMRYSDWTVATMEADSVAVATEIVETYPDTTATVYETIEEGDNRLEKLFGGKDAYEKEIDDAYERSIANREPLYAVALEKYGAIINFNSTSRHYKRPLYDFLAERYTDHLKNQASYNYRLPAQAELLYKDTPEFLKFINTDTVSSATMDYIAFSRDLEAFYLQKKDSISLKRAVLRRLDFMRSQFVRNNEDVYVSTMIKLSHGNTPDAWLAKLRLAQFYYGNESDKHSDYLIKAVALCDEIIGNTINSDAAAAALKLRKVIVKRTISLTTNGFMVPDAPELAALSYNNTPSVTVRYYKLSYKEFTTPNSGYDHYLAYSKDHKPTLEKEYILPGEKDYRKKETEIILPPMPAGIYLMAVLPGGEPQPDDMPGFSIIQAAQVTVMNSRYEAHGEFDVADRVTGKPVKGASIIYENKKYTSNKSGRITIVPKKRGEDEETERISSVIYKKDTIALNIAYLHYYADTNEEEGEPLEKMFLYLDRAIYRPGQELYFKGICTQEKDGVHSIVPNITVFVEIAGDDDNTLKKYTLETNEFGSFSGTFTIPASVMTGNFTVRAYRNTSEYHDGDRAYFRVEEYKRPTFEVVFDPIKEDILLNEDTKIYGVATTFSGAPLPNARVKYVIQQGRYRYNNEAVHAQGEVRTGPDGKFALPFKAVTYGQSNPDDDRLMMFSYNFSVEVTDVGGETRTANAVVNAAKHTLDLSVSIPARVTGEKGASVTFDTQNLNGIFSPAEGEIKIYRLVPAEDRLTGDRPWPAPATYRIPKDEFVKNFPFLPYTNKYIESTRGETVFSQKVNTATSKQLALKGLAKWKTGDYEVVFTPTSEINKNVQATTRFYFSGDENVPGNRLFDFVVTNENFAKDGYIELKIASTTELYVNIQAGHNREGRFNEKQIVIKGAKRTVKVPLPKGLKGPVTINFDFVWQNDNYSYNITKEVQPLFESLQIETVTMNQKMLPGSPQTWSFSIKGKNGAAEVLASMYDASLDQFSRQDWEPVREGRIGEYYHYTQALTGGTAVCFNGMDYERFDIPLYFPDRFLQFENVMGDIALLLIGNKQKEKQVLANGGYMLTGILSSGSWRGQEAIVKAESTGLTAVTDDDGLFRIAVGASDVLEISQPGYRTIKLPVNGKKAIEVTLPRDDSYYVSADQFAGYGAIRMNGRRVIMAASMKVVSSPTNMSISGWSNEYGTYAEPDQGVDKMSAPAESYMKENNWSGEDESNDHNYYRGDVYKGKIKEEIKYYALASPRYLTEEDKPTIKIQPRKNFKETAFFYPHLLAGKDGSITFTFTTPEALTEWKLRLMAHNKDAVSGYLEKSAITQKELMVMPNMPRFLREKDVVTLTTRIVNLSDKALNGNAQLQLFDAVTMQATDVPMGNADNMKPFTIQANGSTTVSWNITVPEGMQGVQYKVLAKAGDFTDGEENILPVLPNSMLVTESIPLWVKPNSTKEYTLENLKNTTSPTLRHQGITLEYTSNPAWLALKSLPYLMEYEHQCAEQVFSRYYANAIAAHIVESNPAIAAVFAEWHKSDRPLSKFAQNEELKSVVMAETPWMLDTESEEEQKNRIALLFDLDRMKTALPATFQQLSEKQSKSGAFPWFDGGHDNEYITRHILAGLGHLQKLGIKQPDEQAYHSMKMSALLYLDGKFMEQVKKQPAATIKDRTILPIVPYDALHYLYARSFYIDPYIPNDQLKKAIDARLAVIKGKWLNYSLYEKGMAALVLHRFGDTTSAKKILESLRQTSANNEEIGMYWIANKPGWCWYNAPIETQALLIEAFTEIDNDTKSADAMKVWLIKQKQNKNWPTTKSTSEAVYALLMKGSEWVSVKGTTAFTLGGTAIPEQKIAQSGTEAGTGYMKLQWKPEEVSKSMATLKIENKSAVPGYGGFYWQYFEDLDKITPAQKGIMNVSKELYRKTNATDGAKLQRITAADPLKIGDLVTIRLVISVKEDVEYVHLKDLRAAAFEPVDVLSEYKWQDGLGYYQSTRDAATHFFFDSIRKGNYVMEYDVRVNNAGEYSNGITTIQSMYAPEFSGHTKGIRVRTEGNR